MIEKTVDIYVKNDGTIEAFLHTNCNNNGNKSCFLTQQVECKIKRLWWQERGLRYTASGCGKKIPTEYMIKYNGRWKRVYCCIFSNAGTFFINTKE